MKRIFPLKLWGSSHNFDIVCQGNNFYYRVYERLFLLTFTVAIEMFLTRKQGEKLTLSQIFRHFKTLDCKWLSKNPNNRVVPSDLKKRTFTLRQMFGWFFNNYVSPLVKVNIRYIHTQLTLANCIYYL